MQNDQQLVTLKHISGCLNNILNYKTQGGTDDQILYELEEISAILPTYNFNASGSKETKKILFEVFIMIKALADNDSNTFKQNLNLLINELKS